MRLCCWRSAQPENSVHRPSVRPPSVHRPSTLAQATNQKTVNKILSNQNICTYICSFLYYWQYYVLFFFISRVFLCLANQNWCRKTINQSNRVSYNKPGGWVEFLFGGRAGRSWSFFFWSCTLVTGCVLCVLLNDIFQWNIRDELKICLNYSLTLDLFSHEILLWIDVKLISK